ncbi:MAG: hypothetical protein WCA10_01035 [Terracidiphilus sp.]
MPGEQKRYHIYDAEAEALSGSLRLPLIQEVKPPTFVKLNERGGYLSQHAENYRLGGAVSFRSAYTQVAGNPDTKADHGWNTLCTSVIEGLNVLDIVTADRIVCQISTDHPLVGYVPTVTFLGTRFDNLRIAGHTVKLDLDLNILGDKPKGDASYTSNRDFIKRVAAQRDHIQSQKNVPTDISKRYNRLPAITAKQGKIECSLVNQSEGGFPGRCFGNAIDVPNFGKIYLAPLTLEQSDFDTSTGAPRKTIISLNMIEMVMGCVGGGTLLGGGGKTNGGTQP